MTLGKLFKDTRILVKLKGVDYEIADYDEKTKKFTLQGMEEENKTEVKAKIEEIEQA